MKREGNGNGRTYDFELCIQLAELQEDFLRDWLDGDHLNQPSLLDYFEWVAAKARGMADDAARGIDGHPPKP